MSQVARFISMAQRRGSPVRYKRDQSMVPCPCRTPEGFRDMGWHIENPGEPMCNEMGMLAAPGSTTDVILRAFMQPIQSTRATRLSTEQLQTIFGEIQADDHLGIFPYEWEGITLNFYDWSLSGEDFVEYNGRRYTCVNANLIPDPSDGNPAHHWEIGARLIGSEPL